MPLTTEPAIMASLASSGVPGNLHDGIERWITHGIQPGSFLTAVFENDLMEAFARADMFSQMNMFSIVSWIYSHAPMGCRGSRTAMQEWALMKAAMRKAEQVHAGE